MGYGSQCDTNQPRNVCYAKPLRARLRLTTDISLGPQRIRNSLDSEGVVRAVQEWLQEVESAEVVAPSCRVARWLSNRIHHAERLPSGWTRDDVVGTSSRWRIS